MADAAEKNVNEPVHMAAHSPSSTLGADASARSGAAPAQPSAAPKSFVRRLVAEVQGFAQRVRAEANDVAERGVPWLTGSQPHSHANEAHIEAAPSIAQPRHYNPRRFDREIQQATLEKTSRLMNEPERLAKTLTKQRSQSLGR